MSIPCKSERSVLSQGELEMVLGTHHPAIYALDGKELRALRVRLREQRSKTRTLARQKQREIRGKAERRGKSFDCDFAFQAHVLTQVDLTHAAFTEQGQNPVVGYGLSD